MEIRDFKDLKVWQQSMNLAENIYGMTKQFPKEELYSLTGQMRRCAISIPSNIAEGSIRRSKPEFSRFVNIASGSLAELETQVILAGRIAYIEMNKIQQLTAEIDAIRKMLFSLHRSLTKSEAA